MGNRSIKDGDRFGMLEVFSSYWEKGHSSKWMHLCVCDCGMTTKAYGAHLIRGATVSCGCKKAKAFQNVITKHSGSRTRTYRIWKGMRRRCNNKNDLSYPKYGGAGIKVCSEWDDYLAFVSDMGECPDGMSIDRIDGCKGYEKRNCRWATDTQQARNTRSRSGLPKGVKRLKSGLYVAQICADYKNHYLGSSRELGEAVKIRKEGELKYWGDNK